MACVWVGLVTGVVSVVLWSGWLLSRPLRPPMITPGPQIGHGVVGEFVFRDFGRTWCRVYIVADGQGVLALSPSVDEAISAAVRDAMQREVRAADAGTHITVEVARVGWPLRYAESRRMVVRPVGALRDGRNVFRDSPVLPFSMHGRLAVIPAYYDPAGTVLVFAIVFSATACSVWLVCAAAEMGRRAWRDRHGVGCCRSCGYSLEGLEGFGVCPECGEGVV